MQYAHRQNPALTRLEVDIELLRRHFARAAGHHRQHGAAVSGDDVVDLEPADAELGEVIVEPTGEGGVHVGDRAVGLGGKKTGRRVIEIVDRVLEILEEGFMPVVIARLVRHRPRHHAVLGRALERANANAVPCDFGLAVGRRRETQLLARPPARFGGLRQAIDRFGDVGGPREQAFDGTQVAGGVRAGERAVGVIGVDDSRFAVGDQNSVRAGIGDRLGGVEARRPGRELEQAKSEQEQAETAAYGEDDDHPGHQRRADGAWREPDGQESPGKAHDQNRERDRIDRALDLSTGGGGAAFICGSNPERTLR